MPRKKYIYEILEDLGEGHTKTIYLGNNVTDAADMFEKMTNQGHSMIWKQYLE